MCSYFVKIFADINVIYIFGLKNEKNLRVSLKMWTLIYVNTGPCGTNKQGKSNYISFRLFQPDGALNFEVTLMFSDNYRKKYFLSIVFDKFKVVRIMQYLYASSEHDVTCSSYRIIQKRSTKISLLGSLCRASRGQICNFSLGSVPRRSLAGGRPSIHVGGPRRRGRGMD